MTFFQFYAEKNDVTLAVDEITATIEQLPGTVSDEDDRRYAESALLARLGSVEAE